MRAPELTAAAALVSIFLLSPGAPPPVAAQGRDDVARLVRITDGIFPVWSPDGRQIAFTRQLEDTFEVYVMDDDGSDQRCLTCGKEALRETGYRGQPYWHPSGDYLVFVAETTKYPRKGRGVTSRPGVGRNNNVWIMNRDATRFWRMTDYEENWGVIRPSFSHDGSKLYWNEEFSMEKYPEQRGRRRPGHQWGWGDVFFSKGEELGAWRVKYGELDFGRDGPKLSNVVTVNPPDGFTLLEGSGFTPDDERLVYSYTDLSEAPGGRALRGDIYTSDLRGGSLRQLTDTPTVHDENAVFSPDGRRIAWCRPAGEGMAGMPGSGEELYVMDADGTNPTRLTFFTDRDSEYYDKNSRQMSEVHWSPDGRRIVLGHASRASKRDENIGSSVWILALGGEDDDDDDDDDDDVKDRPRGEIRPPDQPESGPGGKDYAHRTVHKEKHGRGADEVWLFEPRDPKPRSAPLIVLLHGWGGQSPHFYGAWIDHLVRRGNIVVFPRYQASLFTRPRTFTGHAVDAVKRALELLGTDGRVRPELDKVAFVGHSAGGILAANLAALANSTDLPRPKALMIIEPGSAKDMVPREDLKAIDRGTLTLVVVGGDDDVVGDRDAKQIYRELSHISRDDRDYIRVPSDSRGQTALRADHLMPNAASEEYDEGRRRRRARMQARMDESVNAHDFYGTWKLLDGLTDAAFYGRNRKYALGNTKEQRFLGRWSDGTPVKELEVTDDP